MFYNIKEKIKNKIFEVLRFFKKNKMEIILLLVIVFFVYVNYSRFLDMLFYNFYIFVMLAPFMLIFIFLRLTLLKHIKIGEFLTILSIVLAVLFFSFQNTFKQIEERKKTNNIIELIRGANTYNCAMADSIINDTAKSEGQRFNLTYYITDIYEENVGLIYN